MVTRKREKGDENFVEDVFPSKINYSPRIGSLVTAFALLTTFASAASVVEFELVAAVAVVAAPSSIDNIVRKSSV